ERLEDRLALVPPGRQLVDLHGGGGRQLAAVQRADRLEGLEALRQHVGADAGKARAQIAEALRAEHELAHDEEGPTLADEVERMGRPAGVVVAAPGRAFAPHSYFL